MSYPAPPGFQSAQPPPGTGYPGQSNPADEFLRRVGGPPALSFHDKMQPYRWRGIVRGGRVIADPVIRNVTDPQTGEQKTWKNGDPRRQMVITLACAGGTLTLPNGQVLGAHDERDRSNPEDLGHRRLFVQGYMVDALRKAVEEAGVEGVRVGGELYVAWVDEKKATNPTFNDAKLYQIVYVPPTVAVPAGGAAAPQGGLSGAPAPNPFVAGAVPSVPPGGAFQQVVAEDQARAAHVVSAAQQSGYAGPAYQPTQPGAQFAPQQPAAPQATPAGVVSPDGRAMWNGVEWVPIPAPHVPDPPAAPFAAGPAQYQQAAPPAGPPPAANPFTGR